MFLSVSYYGTKGFSSGLLAIPITHSFSYEAWPSQGNRTIVVEIAFNQGTQLLLGSSMSSFLREQWLDPAKKQMTTACKPHIHHLLHSILLTDFHLSLKRKGKTEKCIYHSPSLILMELWLQNSTESFYLSRLTHKHSLTFNAIYLDCADHLGSSYTKLCLQMKMISRDSYSTGPLG